MHQCSTLHFPHKEMRFLSNDNVNDQPTPETTDATTEPRRNWTSSGGPELTDAVTDFDDNDGEGPEDEEDNSDDTPWSSDPANPDEQPQEAPKGRMLYINPQDRGCWAPRGPSGEEILRRDT